MNKKLTFVLSIIAISIISLSFGYKYLNYDDDYVQISTVKYQGHKYNVIYMDRGGSGNRIKAKYFAAKDPSYGTSVPKRYSNWSDNKNIICVTSGTYMDSYSSDAKPVGLTVDNGIVVNSSIADFDGLVIVYATGGVVATNLEDANLKVQGGEISGIKLDLKNNSYHKTKFLEWCKDNEATVFQTHLLAYKNKIKVSAYNSSSDSRERRFLAVGTDDDGNVIHCIVHSPEYTTLYEGTKRVLNFLNSFKEMNVIFMINLDTGAQDVFELYDKFGNIKPEIKGSKDISTAVNLLVYYYE